MEGSAQQGLSKILLFGEPGCGKTSIVDVIFNNKTPQDTQYNRPSERLNVLVVQNNPFVKYSIWDLPGGYQLEENFLVTNERGDALSRDTVLADTGAIAIILEPDTGEEDDSKFAMLREIRRNVALACGEQNQIPIFVFVHKIDGDIFESEESKITHLQGVQDLIRSGSEDDDISALEYYLTSIFDSTIFEAFSKVVQKLILQQVGIIRLLNRIIHDCLMDKVLLVDVVNKLFLATDHNPMDLAHYEMCSDMLDVVLDVSGIYGWDKEENRAFDEESSSVIKLNNGLVLYLRHVSQNLALVCFIQESYFLREKIIDFNVRKFSQALKEMFESSLFPTPPDVVEGVGLDESVLSQDMGQDLEDQFTSEYE